MNLEQEIRAILFEQLEEFKIPENTLQDIAQLIHERIKFINKTPKYKAAYMTSSASAEWDKMKSGKKKPGPGAKPEII